MSEQKATIRLLKILKITGKIVLVTGLHIGASKETIEIGGNDNPIIKDKDGEPYIPGSSLKGKLRSLLEWKRGEFESDGKLLKEPTEQHVTSVIFGHTSKKSEIGSTRLIVRDAFLDREQRQELFERGIFRSEIKYENTINRLTAEATPRLMERAISGLKFDLEMTYKIFDRGNGDNGKKDEENLHYLIQALKLLELDALGGGGSRGNGKIKFEDLKIWEGDKPIEAHDDLSKVSLDDNPNSNTQAA